LPAAPRDRSASHQQAKANMAIRLRQAMVFMSIVANGPWDAVARDPKVAGCSNTENTNEMESAGNRQLLQSLSSQPNIVEKASIALKQKLKELEDKAQDEGSRQKLKELEDIVEIALDSEDANTITEAEKMVQGSREGAQLLQSHSSEPDKEENAAIDEVTAKFLQLEKLAHKAVDEEDVDKMKEADKMVKAALEGAQLLQSLSSEPDKKEKATFEEAVIAVKVDLKKFAEMITEMENDKSITPEEKKKLEMATAKFLKLEKLAHEAVEEEDFDKMKEVDKKMKAALHA